jgi:integrase
MPVEFQKTFIDNLQPREKEYTVWDKKITGFAVKVTPAGRKVYFYRYRIVSGRQRKFTIGVHGQLTLQQARDIAWGKLLEVKQGMDPMSGKDKYKIALTVAELCDRYVEEYAKMYKKPNSALEDKNLIERHIKPDLGRHFVCDVSRKEVAKFHADRSATPYNANRLRSLISKMFALAEEWELRKEGTNPVKYVKKYREYSRERYLTKSEMENLSKALQECDDDHNLYHVALIRLLLLTGARCGEIQKAKWEWIDFDQKLLLLPDSKTGKRVIFVNAPMMAILHQLPRRKGNPHILAGYKEDSAIGYPTELWNTVKVKVGLTNFRIHDLRHSYATICNQLGFSESMIGALLGHKGQTSITKRYIHHVDSFTREAAEKVAEHIGKVLGIAPNESAAYAEKVIALR